MMSISIRFLPLLSLVAALALPVCATADSIPTPVRTFVQAFVGDAAQSAVRTSAVPDLYEVRLGDQFVYVTADAKFFFHGDLYETRGQRNLTEFSRREVRRDIVDAIDPQTYIVFEPPEPKHTVTVFTDVDCPYCAKFHLEVADLNALGVRVRYAAWPRSPQGTESFARSVSVWCANDPHQAMTDAKAGRKIERAECENPVQAHFDAGRRVGVRGTPTIVTEGGDTIGGYVPYRELVEMLEQG